MAMLGSQQQADIDWCSAKMDVRIETAEGACILSLVPCFLGFRCLGTWGLCCSGLPLISSSPTSFGVLSILHVDASCPAADGQDTVLVALLYYRCEMDNQCIHLELCKFAGA